MTTYRLMDGLSGRPGNGPAVSAYSGNFIAGIMWKVTADNLWLNGYWHWVPSGGDTTARKFALWQLTDTTQSVHQVLVPGATVTSGTLTTNAWNFVPLATPVALSKQVPYTACYGYVATNGFPDTQNQFGSGNTYAAGITNGPLFAYSDQGGSAPEPFTTNYGQGRFDTGSADPAALFPTQTDVHSNFWIDVQVSDTAPANTSYRLWPSQPYAVNWVNDTAFNFTLGCEFTLSGPCTLNKIWFYSQAGVTQLPTEVGIWNVSSHTLVSGTHLTSPTWSGAAASGWISTSFTGVTIPAGDYKVSVYNGAASPGIWNPTTNSYWGAGPGTGGIASGPISAPDTTHATSPGQDTYNQGTPFTYPLTYASGANGANYWVDVEVTPAGAHVDGAIPTFTAARTATARVTRHRGPSRTVTATVTAVAQVTRHRSAARMTTATVTAARSAPVRSAGSRPSVTAAVTAAGSAIRHRISGRSTTASVTAAAGVTRHRSESRPVTVAITARAAVPGGNRGAARPVAAAVTARAAHSTTRTAALTATAAVTAAAGKVIPHVTAGPQTQAAAVLTASDQRTGGPS